MPHPTPIFINFFSGLIFNNKNTLEKFGKILIMGTYCRFCMLSEIFKANLQYVPIFRFFPKFARVIFLLNIITKKMLQIRVGRGIS